MESRSSDATRRAGAAAATYSVDVPFDDGGRGPFHAATQ